MSHIVEDTSGAPRSTGHAASSSPAVELPVKPAERWPTLFAQEPLPAAVVELEAMRHNRSVVVAAVADHPVKVRVATRALRSTALLRHLLMDPEAIAQGGLHEQLQGLACDSVHETLALLDLGFDDILIHTPICTPDEALALAEKIADGRHVIPTVDCREHIALLAEAAVQVGTEIPVCIDVDVSWQPAAEVRFGRLRSPIGDVSAARDLGTLVAETDGTRVTGVSAWASQIADAQRPEARKWWTGPFHGWMNARSAALAADRRVAVVESLKADGHAITLVNGGSTATLATTAADASVTEITVGGAFLCPTRCDSVALDLRPAVFFGARVCRIPDGEHVVVRGAAGAHTPVFPEGLRRVERPGLHSQQTAYTVSGSTPAIGSAVVLRPPSVGPLFDRLEEILLVSESRVVERATTYRGIGVGHL